MNCRRRGRRAGSKLSSRHNTVIDPRQCFCTSANKRCPSTRTGQQRPRNPAGTQSIGVGRQCISDICERSRGPGLARRRWLTEGLRASAIEKAGGSWRVMCRQSPTDSGRHEKAYRGTVARRRFAASPIAVWWASCSRLCQSSRPRCLKHTSRSSQSRVRRRVGNLDDMSQAGDGLSRKRRGCLDLAVVCTAP